MHTNQALRAYGCAECTFLTCQGFERYCGGFPEKRKPKRFWKTDPQWKAPKWCPRRKTPAVYRVYHYKNDGSMLLSNALLHFDGKGHGATAFVSDRHYALVAEGTTQLSARQFLTSSHQQPASTLLDYPDLVYGNVVEIDDGLRPCCFYYRNERKYTNEGRTYSIPAVSFFAASNEVPNFNDPQEKILEALYDRLDLKVVTADIAERDNRLAMLRKKQSGTAGNIAATITLDELKAMQREAAALPVPDSVHELADDILCALRENGIRVSDRKYLNYAPVAQAKAWLSGHAAVMPEDLLALKNYLWDAPQDRETVEQTLRRMCINPMQDKANNILAMALEAQDEFDEIRTGSDDPNVGRKAFIKLRGELIRLYGMQQQLAASTQGPNEAAVTDKLLEELEQSSRQAHEAVGFTYIPLEQQAALQ